jgi:polyhydroxyalkanoate synthesis repressor PhaR
MTGKAERVIKRYANRKLYDTARRRYVTLAGLASLVDAGVELRVVDQASGADLTAQVLAQLLVERVRERSARIPGQVLARLLRLGATPAAAWKEWAAPQQLGARVRAEAERIVAGLLARGRLSLEEGLGLRQEIAGALHGLIGEAQRGFEQGVRSLVVRAAPGRRAARRRGSPPRGARARPAHERARRRPGRHNS